MLGIKTNLFSKIRKIKLLVSWSRPDIVMCLVLEGTLLDGFNVGFTVQIKYKSDDEYQINKATSKI